MTDLVDDVDPDSQNVEVADEDAAVLLDQLRLLGEPSTTSCASGTNRSTGWLSTAMPR